MSKQIIYQGILAAVGNTPLVKLNRIFEESPFHLYAKLEFLNPGGSIKDRPAFNVIKCALDNGEIDQNTTVIESSSGNFGIGLAQACRYFGLRLICVVDPKTTTQNIKIIEAYGATIDFIAEPDPETGEFLQARIKRVQHLLDVVPNSFWPNQYANLNNPRAHYQTMREIVSALNGDIDYLFCATSTCGVLRGCAEYIQQNNLKTKVIAVDAQGSVIFSGKAGKRLIPGHGAARMPELYQDTLASDFVLVSDLECVVGCRRLLDNEAILAGGSSGGIISAISKIKGKIPYEANCVAMICDHGSRYLDTIYADSWVLEHFGNVLPKVNGFSEPLVVDDLPLVGR